MFQIFTLTTVSVTTAASSQQSITKNSTIMNLFKYAQYCWACQLGLSPASFSSSANQSPALPCGRFVATSQFTSWYDFVGYASIDC